MAHISTVAAAGSDHNDATGIAETTSDWTIVLAVSEHQAIFDLINTRADQLSAQIEQVRSTVVAEADTLKAAIDTLVESVNAEIAQLAAASANATELSDLKAAVNASVSRLQGLDAALKADDPATP